MNDGGEIRHLIDRQAILDCLTRYCRGVDRFDRELVLSAYHSDAIDDHGAFVGTREEFIDWAFALHEKGQISTRASPDQSHLRDRRRRRARGDLLPVLCAKCRRDPMGCGRPLSRSAGAPRGSMEDSDAILHRGVVGNTAGRPDSLRRYRRRSRHRDTRTQRGGPILPEAAHWPISASGSPTTMGSATSGSARSAASTSSRETFVPDVFSVSPRRSWKKRWPSSSIRTMSPVG